MPPTQNNTLDLELGPVKNFSTTNSWIFRYSNIYDSGGGDDDDDEQRPLTEVSPAVHYKVTMKDFVVILFVLALWGYSITLMFRAWSRILNFSAEQLRPRGPEFLWKWLVEMVVRQTRHRKEEKKMEEEKKKEEEEQQQQQQQQQEEEEEDEEECQIVPCLWQPAGLFSRGVSPDTPKAEGGMAASGSLGGRREASAQQQQHQPEPCRPIAIDEIAAATVTAMASRIIPAAADANVTLSQRVCGQPRQPRQPRQPSSPNGPVGRADRTTSLDAAQTALQGRRVRNNETDNFGLLDDACTEPDSSHSCVNFAEPREDKNTTVEGMDRILSSHTNSNKFISRRNSTPCREVASSKELLSARIIEMDRIFESAENEVPKNVGKFTTSHSADV